MTNIKRYVIIITINHKQTKEHMKMSVQKDKKVILAIDDVSMNLIVIKSLLSEYFDIRAAKSAELALFILGSVEVDLILLDIEMPGMSGFDFINVVREIPNVKDIPIICVTSHAKPNVINKAINAGVKDYVIKPIEPLVLKEKVFAALNMTAPKQ